MIFMRTNEWHVSAPAQSVRFAEDSAVAVPAVVAALAEQREVTTLSVVHHETTAGVLNPLEQIAKEVPVVLRSFLYYSRVSVEFFMAFSVRCRMSALAPRPEGAYVTTLATEVLDGAGSTAGSDLPLDLPSQTCAFEQQF